MESGTCIHFTGIGVGSDYRTKTCNAGVCYFTAFNGREGGIMCRMPCIQFYIVPARGKGTYIHQGEATKRTEVDRHGHIVIHCEHYLEPTTEEIEAYRKERDDHMAKTMAAIRVASEWRIKPKPDHDRMTIVICPICQGQLHLSQLSYNGHVHGNCETADCVAWME